MTGAGTSTISDQHLLQKKLIQVKKNDVTVTMYLSVLEAPVIALPDFQSLYLTTHVLGFISFGPEFLIIFFLFSGSPAST